MESYKEVNGILKQISMEPYRKSKESLRKSIWNPIGIQRNPQGHLYGILAEIKRILKDIYIESYRKSKESSRKSMESYRKSKEFSKKPTWNPIENQRDL